MIHETSSIVLYYVSNKWWGNGIATPKLKKELCHLSFSNQNTKIRL